MTPAEMRWLLTVMEIYNRKVLIYMLRHHIKKGDVLLLLSLMLLEYKVEGMYWEHAQ